MRTLRRAVGAGVAAAVLLALALMLWGWARRHPQDLPWTPLDLAQPIGAFTGRKLTALTGDYPRCQALLTRAGVHYTALAPLTAGPQCGYADAVRLDPGGARRVALKPPGLGTSCPVAAALAIWEWDVVQPAALARFGQQVVRIDHFGSYNCRRMYGRDTGSFSEHATADAIDIAAFVLADGTRISVVADWSGGGKPAAFLRDVHDGACRLFATVLGPDYNAAHRDHFHLDQAERGTMGWRACR
jgi:hypothetical protein